MARIAVTDPDGVEWRVWRRWYAWRRWVTLRDVGRGFADTNGDLEFLIAFPILVVGLAATLLDLVAQLVVLPFAVLARLVRLTSWPVQLDRADKHVATRRVKGFGRAGVLRDEQVARVRDGSLPDRPLPEAAAA